MNDTRDFLRQAIKLAADKSAAGDCGPFGAVIVKNDNVISEGWNQVVSSHDPTAHAEVMAIRKACAELGTHNLTGCVLYASCEPCPMCLAAAYWARVDKVVYAASREDAAAIGFDDEFLYREVALSPEERSIEFLQMLREEGAKVMKEWADSPASVMY